uniref:CocE/NonD family hydrolase n=1 Tax=Lentilactobacillus hilgardii TaxID=1588 RepID=UPI00403F24BE
MTDLNQLKVYRPSLDYIDDGKEHGVLSKFEPGTRILPKGYQVSDKFKPLDCDIVFEKDVPIKLRDGVTIYADVFRPNTNEKVPVIMAWSPYGKSAGTAPRYENIFGIIGLKNNIVSGLEKFEGPDPAYWCQQGYAICNPDERGIAHSEGDASMIGTQEGRDGYDVIEWLAAQSWCTGKVAMSGTSYLAFSQWFIAAEQPPHLAAINPTEGLSDGYRDMAMRGGIPDEDFVRRIQANHVNVDDNQHEDVTAEMKKYPLINHPVWQDKIVKFDQIQVPTYLVASYGNTLHTNGTFRAWRQMGSKQKWLRIHNSQEWPDYYDAMNTEDRKRFFDYFLKDVQNGWEETPKVRYAMLDMAGGDETNIAGDEFPPSYVDYQKFHLDGVTRELRDQVTKKDVSVTYTPEMGPGKASFIKQFSQRTEMIGYPKVHLNVQAKDADDMELFVVMQKLDQYGNQLSEFVVPNHGAMMHDFTDNGGTVMKYKGPDGRLRVSVRHLDEAQSTDAIPVHSFDRVEKLSPNEVVPVDIVLMPMGMVFNPGEQLRLVISAKNEAGSIVPWSVAYESKNKGRQVIHCGGEYDSYLQVPVKLG